MSASTRSLSVVRDLLLEYVRPGSTELSTPAMWRYGRVGLAAAIALTNVIGGCAVLVLAIYVIPLPTIADQDHVRLVNVVAALVYLAAAVAVGIAVGIRWMWPIRRWLLEERRATVREKKFLLRAPLRLFGLQVALWWVAAVGFGALNGAYSVALGIRVVIIVAIVGMVVASFAYLLTEQMLRVPAARALADGMPQRLAVPGVATRAVLAWALGTGLPVLALTAIGILAITGDVKDPIRLGIAIAALGGTALSVGLLAVGLAARLTAAPIDSVRRALGRVEKGDLDVNVPVYDGTQVGQLQLGFNRMVAGLAERERIREAFGTYVDRDVAEHILREGTSLEGEEVEVTMLFLDIRDFTSFADRLSAREVVAALNRLFERIVPIIHRHGGHVDKYVGDGLLAVFGAPRRYADHADRALAAAVEIAAAVQEEFGSELRVGIGLNSGPVVAGNVGGAGRLEFSVIGDAVNVAARVESATRRTGDPVLITGRTKELLDSVEFDLVQRPGLDLKGKTEPVEIYAPVERSRA